jgi:prevent-host-death family protein
MTGQMQIAASDFKARCLALLDQVHQTGEEILITKRGQVIARLVHASSQELNPLQELQGSGKLTGNPYAPTIDESEIKLS